MGRERERRIIGDGKRPVRKTHPANGANHVSLVGVGAKVENHLHRVAKGGQRHARASVLHRAVVEREEVDRVHDKLLNVGPGGVLNAGVRGRVRDAVVRCL